MTDQDTYDVAVLGGGNAGLCAALTAREAGARVIVVESAPRHFRGGNSRHTRNLRCMHAGPSQLLTDSYSEDEFLSDLIRVSGHETDEAQARLVVRASAGCPEWMRRFGVRFQSPLRGTLHLGRTNAFFLGGGKALMNSYYAAAERLGIRVRVRRRSRRPRAGRRALPCRDGAGRRARSDDSRRRRCDGDRRIRVQPRLAARDLGRRRRQLHHPRHAVQHRARSSG